MEMPKTLISLLALRMKILFLVSYFENARRGNHYEGKKKPQSLKFLFRVDIDMENFGKRCLRGAQLALNRQAQIFY
jgi:hypothetical protein